MSKYAGTTHSFENFENETQNRFVSMFDNEDWKPLTKSNRYDFPMSKKRLKRMRRPRRGRR